MKKAHQFLLIILAPSITFAIADKLKLIAFSENQDYAATITLFPQNGKVGRSTPIFNNYRPQLSFSVGTKEVTCAIHISDTQEKIEPSQTAEVAVTCRDPFEAAEKDLSFAFFEGGRKVGVGRLKP